MNGINRRSLFGWLSAMPFAAASAAAAPPKFHNGGFVTPNAQTGEIVVAHLRADPAVYIRDRSFGDGMSLRVIQHRIGFVTVERVKQFKTAGRTNVHVKLFHLRGSADDDFRLNDAGALIHNGEIVGV
jgi:hypothetical protein